jgi:hypothetical protein
MGMSVLRQHFDVKVSLLLKATYFRYGNLPVSSVFNSYNSALHFSLK